MPWVDRERGLWAVPGMLKEVQGGKSGSAGRCLAPGARPDSGRFTCSLIRERGGKGVGLGERQHVETGRLHGPCGRWQEKLSSASPASGAGAMHCWHYGACCPWRGWLSISGVPRSVPGPGCPTCSLSATQVLWWQVLGGCCCLGAMVSCGRKAMTLALLTQQTMESITMPEPGLLPWSHIHERWRNCSIHGRAGASWVLVSY